MHIDYHYTHAKTVSGTGYYTAIPTEEYPLEDLVSALSDQPYDTFLHTYVLTRMAEEGHDLLVKPHDPVRNALCAEARILAQPEVTEKSCEGGAGDMVTPLPLLDLVAQSTPERRLWNARIRENREWGKAVPTSPVEEGAHVVESCSALRARLQALAWPEEPSVPNLYRDAMDALLEGGFLAGPEKRHEASLAPIALLRDWNLACTVHSGRNDYTLTGTATAYGRGLSLGRARLSCVMEIVERASSYVSLSKDEVLQRKQPMPLVRATVAELAAQGRAFVDPNTLALERPAPAATYTWVTATTPEGREVLVPCQAVFLFCNCDEPELFRSYGSTGLAAGATYTQAKISALLEVLERDAEASVPFARDRVFTLTCRDPVLGHVLNDYRARSIVVQFQEKTSEFGIPVYQAFVRRPDGFLVGAHACHLSGQRALIQALTEVAWPYSVTAPAGSGTATGPGFPDVPERLFEDLPSLALANPAANLALLEQRLAAFGYTPLYVDLTRSDLGIPVVRAIIPGLEVAADCDPLASPPRRLVARCCR